MISQAKILPPEIWLYTFTFLEGHDIVRSFSCLNAFFNSLLHSPYLQLYIRIRQNESNERLPDSTWSHIHLQNIYSISVGRRKANCLIQFLRWHAQYLVSLRSLSIYLRKSKLYINIQFLIFALEQIPSLKRIRIKYIAKSDQNIDNLKPLTTYIFSERSTLQKCSFVLNMSDYNMITSQWSINRLLKYLNISSISSIDLVSLLSFTPQLHSLQTMMDACKVISYKNVVLTPLEKVILRLDRSYFTQLEAFKEIVPNLQSLRLEGDFNTKDDNFFNENMWHKLLNNIKYFYVNLKVFEFTDSEKINLKNRFPNCEGKSWFSWVENAQYLKVIISFKSTTA
ncbi:unnamed protein product [Rotaria sp. Silwood2]|nr:unnamed protein product [Rotaria sp. Silwood2]CAF4335811.1 unnamed protein product [Rotaria sp. Silwood2]